MAEVRTVSGALSIEIEKIKGSRFIADMGPAANERAATDLIAAVRAREPSATHHCFAYRLGSGIERSSDDGEPRDTGGPPILRRILAADLSDVVIVVTRYYGGTNLGRGGLIRAYGAAAAAVIDEATFAVRPITELVSLEHSYEMSGQVESVMAGFGADVITADYGKTVTLGVAVPAERVSEFIEAMAEATAGTVECEKRG